MVSSVIQLTEIQVSESPRISLKAEEVFAKTNEYLQSGGQEIWLVFPESQWIVVITQQQRFLFTRGEVVSTQLVLLGFSIAVDDLLA